MLRAMVVEDSFAFESESFQKIPHEMLEGLDENSYISDCADWKICLAVCLNMIQRDLRQK